MNKMTIAIATVVVGGAFVGGVAVGMSHKEAKYTSYEEMKWDDLGGPKMAGVSGDYKKGAFAGLFKIPAGFTSPMHTHTGAYEAVMIMGTSSHWGKGEDGTKAKKLTPGSYWSMPAKMEHVSSCAAGADCVMLLWQKTKWDYKEVKAAADPKKTEPAKANPKQGEPLKIEPAKAAPAKTEPAKPAPAKTEPAKKM